MSVVKTKNLDPSVLINIPGLPDLPELDLDLDLDLDVSLPELPELPDLESLIPGLPSVSINCSSGLVLDLLDAQKLELQGLIGDISGGGAGALSGLTSKVDTIKGLLEGMIPEIPKVPNFLDDINSIKSLKGAALAAALAQVENRWGGVIPDISDMVSKLQSGEFDICCDIPNIDGTNFDASTGKVTAIKEKGPAPTTPTAIPKVVEPLKPTVVQQEKLPSSSEAIEKPSIEVWEATKKYVKEINKVLRKKAKEQKPWQKHWAKVKSSKDWMEMSERRQAGGYEKNSTYYNSGKASGADKAVIEKASEGHNEYQVALAERVYMGKISKHFDKAYDDESWESYVNIEIPIYSVYSKSGSSISFKKIPLTESQKSGVINQVLEVANKYKEDILTWNGYKQNIQR